MQPMKKTTTKKHMQPKFNLNQKIWFIDARTLQIRRGTIIALDWYTTVKVPDEPDYLVRDGQGSLCWFFESYLHLTKQEARKSYD